MIRSIILISLLAASFPLVGSTQSTIDGATAPAEDLAAAMRPKPSTGFFLKMSMEVAAAGQAKSSLNVQVKGRRLGTTTDLLYQIQWPKDRKGEGVLIHWKDGKFDSGYTYKPGGDVVPLTRKDLLNPMFGSELTLLDTDMGFWDWEKQSDKGTGKVGKADCRIIDLEPANSRPDGYRRVRAWIDPAKLVPMKIEKFTDEGLARVIVTTDIAKTDDGRFIPKEYTVGRSEAGPATKISGTKQELVEFEDAQFTPEAMKVITIK